MHKNQTKAERASIAREMRAIAAKVPTYVIADHDGNCFANVLVVAGQFRYDVETGAWVCHIDRDGRDIIHIFTEGEIKLDSHMNKNGYYTITAPMAE